MPRKNFKSSSYDRVAGVLMTFPEWKEVAPAFVRNLDSLKVRAACFTRGSRYDHGVQDTVMYSYAYFVVENADKEEVFRVSEEQVAGKAEDLSIDVEKFLPKKEIERVVNLHFATPMCPTFNCKKDKVVAKLVELATEKLRSDYLGHILSTKERLHGFCVEQSQTDEFKEKKTRTFDVGVISEIKKVFHKYANKVGAEVLKEAWQEYVAEDIMEA